MVLRISLDNIEFQLQRLYIVWLVINILFSKSLFACYVLCIYSFTYLSDYILLIPNILGCSCFTTLGLYKYLDNIIIVSMTEEGFVNNYFTNRLGSRTMDLITLRSFRYHLLQI
jgi:putative Mn2+ efflux pump MntP